MALSLTSRNAPELLQEAREFRLGEAWFAGGMQGSEIIQLRNFLGDQGRPARSLLQSQPPPALGSVKLAYYRLERGRGAALEITYSGRRMIIFPPAGLAATELPPAAAAGRLEVLVVPREPAQKWLSALKPAYVVVYGRPEKDRRHQTSVLNTREGAVTLLITSKELTVKQ